MKFQNSPLPKIREFAAEKDQSGDWRKATEILATIGEKYVPDAI